MLCNFSLKNKYEILYQPKRHARNGGAETQYILYMRLSFIDG